MAYQPLPNLGQATAANSLPVVLSSDINSVDTELPAAAALADGASNPTAPFVSAAASAYNGTTWDRVRTIDALSGTGANNTVAGILAVGTGPGYSHRYNPTALATATNSATTIDVEGGNTMAWAIGTTTTGTVIFEGTADATNWFNVEVFDASADVWVSGQSLTPTLGKVYYTACGGLRQIRMRVNATLGATVSHTVTVTSSQQLLAGIDTGAAPHNFGYNLVHKDGEYTTAQTGTIIWTPTTGKRFAITDITLSVYSTTSGVITLFDAIAATTTYSPGSVPAILRINVQPQINLTVGVVKTFNVPYVSISTSNVLHITSSTSISFYWQLNGYEI